MRKPYRSPTLTELPPDDPRVRQMRGGDRRAPETVGDLRKLGIDVPDGILSAHRVRALKPCVNPRCTDPRHVSYVIEGVVKTTEITAGFER